MHIDHFNICAPAELLRQEKQFLCDVFDLREGFRPELSSPGYWLYDGDNALVHLSESDTNFDAEAAGHLDHVAFQLTELQKFLENLIRRKIDYYTISRAQNNAAQVFIRTPLGIKIEANFAGESLKTTSKLHRVRSR